MIMPRRCTVVWMFSKLTVHVIIDELLFDCILHSSHHHIEKCIDSFTDILTCSCTCLKIWHAKNQEKYFITCNYKYVNYIVIFFSKFRLRPLSIPVAIFGVSWPPVSEDITEPSHGRGLRERFCFFDVLKGVRSLLTVLPFNSNI